MEKNLQDRVLGYTLSTPIDQETLAEVTGGANENPCTRVIITGDYQQPDVIIEK